MKQNMFLIQTHITKLILRQMNTMYIEDDLKNSNFGYINHEPIYEPLDEEPSPYCIPSLYDVPCKTSERSALPKRNSTGTTDGSKDKTDSAADLTDDDLQNVQPKNKDDAENSSVFFADEMADGYMPMRSINCEVDKITEGYMF